MGVIMSVFLNSVSKMPGLAVQVREHSLEATLEDRCMEAHGCSPGTPERRWELETEESSGSPGASRPGARTTVALTRQELTQQGGRQELTPKVVL